MLEFRVLGPLEVLHDGRALAIGGQRQKALLAALLLRAGEVVSAERLIDDLWGEEPPDTASGVLQSYASRLRKILEPASGAGTALVGQRPGYVLHLTGSRFDLADFAREREAAQVAREAGDHRESARHSRAALALFRGSPLADFRYEDFARAEVERLDELRLATLEDRIEADLACGRETELVGELRGLLLDHPFRERLAASLVTALYRAGRQAEALDAYRRTRDALAEELGIDPSPALQRLEVAILNQDPDLDGPPPSVAVVVPASSTSSAGVSDAPRVASPRTEAAGTTSRARPRLVEAPGPLIGRERDAAAIAAMIERDVRCVTITGPGGTGKTRLALEVARAARGVRRDGTWWVDLSTVSDPTAVAAAIAGTLGLEGVAGRDDLVRAMLDWDALLVLDNFEQVVGAAELVAALLAAAPGIQVLVTSRVPLRILAEQEVPLGPLDLGDPAGPLDPGDPPAALALFAARAAAARPGFDLRTVDMDAVRRLCQAVDGLPLGIELIAARARMLTPGEMVTQLETRTTRLSGPRDLPERQRSLEATFDWSIRLLDPASARLLMRLAVFVGGFTLDGATVVAGEPGDDVTGALETLLDASLVSRRDGGDGTTRFVMFETIRAYAAERCHAAGELEAVRERHYEWYTSVTERAAATHLGSDGRPWYRQLAPEIPNLESAMRYASEPGREVRLARLAAASQGVFWHAGARAVIRRSLEAAHERIDGLGDRDRATILRELGGALLDDGDARAAGILEEATALARRAGDDALLALVLETRAVGDAYFGTEAHAGEAPAAEALAVADRIGNDALAARALNAWGLVSMMRGELPLAVERFERAAAAFRRNDQPDRATVCLNNVAWGVLVQGDAVRAAEIAADAAVLAARYDLPVFEALLRQTLGLANLLMGKVDAAAGELQASLVANYRLGADGEVATCLEGLAAVAAALGRPRDAARLAGAARLDASGIDPTDLLARPGYLGLLERAREELGDAAWTIGLADGAALSRRAAVAAALELSGPVAGPRAEG